MLLIAQFDRIERDKIVNYIGIVENIDELLKWYATHSVLQPRQEKDFLIELINNKNWTKFHQGSIYGVLWVNKFNVGCFDK